nr:reverse transcriptase [Tanacetum cinerariifolium]
MNQQREQEALLAAQREQELRKQEQATQEKEEPPQNSDYRQLIREMKIEKEVYVCQLPGFEDPNFLDRVYKVEKALYGLHQALRAWYKTLSTYLLENGFQRGKIDKTLFIKRQKDLIGMAMNTMLLSINLKSKRLDKEKQEVKNIEFSGELAHIDPIPLGIEEADFDLEEEICLVENFSYDNSSPQPPKELNAKITDMILESLFPFPIPVEDSDSHMEEIDLFLATDDLMPPDTLIDSSPKFDYLLKEFSGKLAHIDPIPLGIEEADFDLEEEIYLVENFSDSHMEEIDLFLATDDLMPPGIETDDYDSERTKVVKGISEHYVLMPNIFPTLLTLDPDLDFTPSYDSLRSRNKIFDLRIFIDVQSERLLSREEFSISFIRDPLYPVFDTWLLFSSKNKDKVFKPGILSYLLVSHQDKTTFDFSENPMMIHAGNPTQPHWSMMRVLDLTTQKMRLGGGYDWKAEMDDWGCFFSFWILLSLAINRGSSSHSEMSSLGVGLV